jgi:hypothetical protein
MRLKFGDSVTVISGFYEKSDAIVIEELNKLENGYYIYKIEGQKVCGDGVIREFDTIISNNCLKKLE